MVCDSVVVIPAKSCGFSAVCAAERSFLLGSSINIVII